MKNLVENPKNSSNFHPSSNKPGASYNTRKTERGKERIRSLERQKEQEQEDIKQRDLSHQFLFQNREIESVTEINFIYI